MEQGLQRINSENKLRQWAERVSACRGSGKSVAEWCHENGFCTQTYYKWQKRIFLMAQSQTECRFTEITSTKSARRADIAAIVRISGVEAEICNGADAATIGAVLRGLRSC